MSKVKLTCNFHKATPSAMPENPYVTLFAGVLFEVATEHEELDHFFKICLIGTKQKDGKIFADPEFRIKFESHPQTHIRRKLGGSVEVVEPGSDTEIEEILYAAFGGRDLSENFNTQIDIQVETLTDRGNSRRCAVKVYAQSDDRCVVAPDACWIVDMKISSWSEYGNRFVGATMKLVGDCLDQNLPLNLCRQAFPELDM